ncbi:30S ribosomal protein S19e [Candidatus Poseidoniales archaeon]|nr:30S ribosomal protein S19e [Candidatus Poseidoniales archaeon]MDC3317504.1 30S ribosomal protein S19e [Candidatus Poseidoniaceae archaeon]MDA8715945.1 30S ribosomal protein S19e [Candidatus Poseidoniales archaeon]MDA8717640.1 30S ribosomal protein S19e [Candidatus Poseidoniales archaeon]MDB2367414.1 30S ribosomal protein S19e [Candidatus Poseidoniales archaeon]|tara:strand:- start:381 stop:875 length:495 start_codon:yes stop_codon:yes gene_type:complete
MTTIYDVPANFLIPAVAEQLKSNASISMPEWAQVVKTGSSRERPPSQTDWWHIRGAAMLRKIARQGPIGVTLLSQEYGGRKNNGSKPNTPGVGSRKVIRAILQQLEDAGLVVTQASRVIEHENREPTQLYSGRVITPAGHKLLNEVAHAVRPDVEAEYPGLDKY